MSTERVANALNGLHKLAEQIGNSQRFGQPLPVGTTKEWSAEIERIETELRDCTGVRAGAPVTGLARDFTVIANY